MYNALVAPLVEEAFSGVSASVLAYGASARTSSITTLDPLLAVFVAQTHAQRPRNTL